jgi:hypothetical protein
MKVPVNILATILEHDVINCIMEKIIKKYGKRNRKYMQLVDVCDIMGDGPYRKFVLKKLIFC